MFTELSPRILSCPAPYSHTLPHPLPPIPFVDEEYRKEAEGKARLPQKLQMTQKFLPLILCLRFSLSFISWSRDKMICLQGLNPISVLTGLPTVLAMERDLPVPYTSNLTRQCNMFTQLLLAFHLCSLNEHPTSLHLLPPPTHRQCD